MISAMPRTMCGLNVTVSRPHNEEFLLRSRT